MCHDSTTKALLAMRLNMRRLCVCVCRRVDINSITSFTALYPKLTYLYDALLELTVSRVLSDVVCVCVCVPLVQ